MAPKDVVHGLLEQEDRRMSEVASTFVQGLPVPFKLDENHFPYVLATCVNLKIGTVMPLFCMAMAWSSAHTGLRSVVMYVCKWMKAVAASWQEGKFKLISRNRRTEVAVHRKCVFAVDMKGLFCTFWGRQSFLQNEHQGWWQELPLITKIGSSEHIYNEIDKTALLRCFVCYPRYVWRIFLHTSMKWWRTTCTFTWACMYAGVAVAMDKKWRLSLLLKQEDVLSVGGCFDFRARFA